MPSNLQALRGGSAGLLQGSQQQQWLPDRAAMQQSGLLSWSCIPEGVQSAFVQAVSQNKVLLVLAERPRWGLPHTSWLFSVTMTLHFMIYMLAYVPLRIVLQAYLCQWEAILAV